MSCFSNQQLLLQMGGNSAKILHRQVQFDFSMVFLSNINPEIFIETINGVMLNVHMKQSEKATQNRSLEVNSILAC